MNALRPSNFTEFIGQESVKKNLSIFIESSIKRNKPLDHILIHGGSGLGKTSLSYIIANTLKQKIIILNGTSLQKPSEIISPLTKLKPGNIIFIDEIHAISKEVSETLLPVLEDGKMSLIIGKDYNSKTINIDVSNFTLIGATTEIDKINSPFLNRFPIIFYFKEYQFEEISKIVEINLKKLNINFSKDSVSIISNSCKENPRQANNLIKRIYDYYLIEKLNFLDKKNIIRILKNLQIFKHGLSIIELDYLKLLKRSKSLGLNSISQIIGVPIRTIINNIEPILLKKNLVEKTNSGRSITKNGIIYLNKIKTQT